MAQIMRADTWVEGTCFLETGMAETERGPGSRGEAVAHPQSPGCEVTAVSSQ